MKIDSSMKLIICNLFLGDMQPKRSRKLEEEFVKLQREDLAKIVNPGMSTDSDQEEPQDIQEKGDSLEGYDPAKTLVNPDAPWHK